MACGFIRKNAIFTRRDSGYVCITLKYPDIVQLINAPIPVVRAVHLVCQRVRANYILYHGDNANITIADATNRAREDTPLTRKYGGAVEMSLGGYVFVRDNVLHANAVGKHFATQLFCTMDKLGYDFFHCSNFSTVRGGCCETAVKPTWLFVNRAAVTSRAKQSGVDAVVPRSRLRSSCSTQSLTLNDVEETPLKMLFIEPRAHDQLYLFGAEQAAIEAVKIAITDAWPEGIKSESREDAFGSDVVILQLHGFPWFTTRPDESDEADLNRAYVNVQAKRLLVHMIGELARIHYKYVTATNLMGLGDTYILVYDSFYASNPQHFCAITLDYNNRMRLIKCSKLFTQISVVIDEHFSPVLHHTPGTVFAQRANDPSLAEDVHEFTLRHLPWRYSVLDKTKMCAPAQVKLLTALVEFMATHGCRFMGCMRTAEDRSVLLFHHERRSISLEAFELLSGHLHVASMSLLGNTEVHLSNMAPPLITECMDVAYLVYKPGIKEAEREYVEDSRAYFLLKGKPWADASDASRVHGVNLVLFLMATAQDAGFDVVASVEMCGVEGKEDTDNGAMTIVMVKS